MPRISIAVFVFLFCFGGSVGSATGTHAADKRIALVIGNSAYKYTAQLPNPKNDATAMARTLKTFGFEVVEGIDLDKVAFDQKIREFAALLKGAAAGVFFYAGHGLQVSGKNYLVPTDAKVEGFDALDLELIKAITVQRIMEQLATTNILFLDACRNNPLSRNLARAVGTRAVIIGRGFRGMEGGVGTLISFSTAPDTVALDGGGQNSPYTAALVHQLTTSNDDLMGVLVAVRNDVIKATRRAQVPWEHSALLEKFYFSRGTRQGVSPPSAATASGPKVASTAPPSSPTAQASDIDGKWVGRWGGVAPAEIKIEGGEVVEYIYLGKPTLIARNERKDRTLTFGSQFYTVVLTFDGPNSASGRYNGTRGTNSAKFKKE